MRVVASAAVVGVSTSASCVEGFHAQRGSSAHIDSGTQVLKFLPMEKAKDARNFVQALQYWLGGNRENLENLLLSTAQVCLAAFLSRFTPHAFAVAMQEQASISITHRSLTTHGSPLLSDTSICAWSTQC